MRSILNLPVRRVWIGWGVVFIAGVALGMALTLPSEAAMQAPERTFSGQAGLMFNPIRQDKATDFEQVLGRLKQALQESENPVRRQQLSGWRVFKSTEPVQGNIMYIFVLDPAVRDANYAVSVILNEAFPSEVQALYERFSGAYNGGQSMMNLELVASFSN